MSASVIVAVDINPVPWKSPHFNAIRTKNGRYISVAAKNHEVANYKEAIQDALKKASVQMLAPPYDIKFWFYRQTGKHDNVADATNMQKATEDALQGVLIDNDRDVITIVSNVMEICSEVPEPCVVIEVSGNACRSSSPPPAVLNAIAAARAGSSRAEAADNSWI